MLYKNDEIGFLLLERTDLCSHARKKKLGEISLDDFQGWLQEYIKNAKIVTIQDDNEERKILRG